MRTTQLRICLKEGNIAGVTGPDLFQYFATAIERKERYYYQVGSETLEITRPEYLQVISNPYLYYFSTALKMHLLIKENAQK